MRRNFREAILISGAALGSVLLCPDSAQAQQYTLNNTFNNMTQSAANAQTFELITYNGGSAYDTIWISSTLNVGTYQGYYSPFVPTVRQVNDAGASITYQSQGYRYITAAFSAAGLYRLRISSSNGDAAGAVYAGSPGTLPYDPSNPQNNLVAYSEDNNDTNPATSPVDPFDIYYNQSTSNCTFVQFLVWQYGGNGSGLTGTFQIDGPGAIAADCNALAALSAPTGPSAANTRIALQANSGAVRSVLIQRAAATTYALDYDCSVFDEHGFCVTVGARNTQIGSNYGDSGETAGLLTAAYRVTPEFRIGGFIDQNLVSNSPTGVTTKNTQPMLGAFAVYQENPNFSGLMIRAALAYQEGDLRITRPQLDNTEPGTGRTRTSALAFGGEIAYGVPLDNTWVAQPYAGLRRSDSQRRGYTEATSDSVEYPITYNRFGQQVTSATAGLRLRGAITPEFSLTFGAGMEHDLNSKMDRYAGTSTITQLETFSIPASQQQNELRAVGSAGMRYMVASNQAVAFDASVRQLPYGNDPSITTMLRYSIGF
jgi:hypothetical protein